MNLNEAFDEFRSRLETTETEDKAASRRQKKIREELEASFDVKRDFLTGSYVRHTKTKPLRDVDIMVVMTDRTPLGKHPRVILDAVTEVLKPIYGRDRVTPDRRAVRVDFGLTLVSDVTGDVMSVEVVPAFSEKDHYLIPDDLLGEWIKTNPEVHKNKARDANDELSGYWKPIVKIVKKWNDEHGQPVTPSFLIEVMALDLVNGPWVGPYPREVRQFFASAADRLGERWPDPAGVGPDVNDILRNDAAALASARSALLDAERACTEAMRLERDGRTGAALAAARELFGSLFPMR
jgi:predicted nucleotidyltransferase